MKRTSFFVMLLALLLSGCWYISGGEEPPIVDPVANESAYVPVIMKRSDLEASIIASSPRAIQNPGKMYLLGDYVFLNERYEGIHVIDNSDPTNPLVKAFIQVPGCVDIAVKDKVLYADNAVDLVALDITLPVAVKETKRIYNVLPELYPPDANFIPWEYQKEQRQEGTVIVGWEKKAE
ncbi:hypothetical protein V6R21_31715 [Limibacter armeniacum]|uniref:hypothetical protein n=1 Tax=Limibacter armeniacum TaxID=466084 RepID=UPI002FE5DB36